MARPRRATIGITDETATSIHLLKVLLEKKYGVKTNFERLHAGVNDWSAFDAVLLIGDEALRGRKFGVEGFALVFDLAREWYEWQKLPFVFAVWARQKSMSEDAKRALDAMIARSLEESSRDYGAIGSVHGRRIGLSLAEVADYLGAFTFRLGAREKEAMERFKQLVDELASLQEAVVEETLS